MGTRAAFCLFLTLVGCGQAHEQSLSSTKYRLGGSGYAGLTRKVTQNTIRLCFSDPTNSQQHRTDAVESVMKWVEALREVTNEPLAQNVELVAPNGNCDAIMRVGNYSPAFTQIGSKPAVHVNYNGWFGSSTVTLHEFGHAFGLLDTYRGSGGSCQSGQPDSVMCRASYEELKDDDISGVREMYRMVASGLYADDASMEGKILF